MTTRLVGDVRSSRGLARHETRGQWWRFVVVLIITAITLYPLFSVLAPIFLPGAGNSAPGRGADGSNAPSQLLTFFAVFQYSPALQWLTNSLIVTLSTVAVAILVGAPAGYVIARARNRAVSVYGIVIFALQSLPVILFVIPLFVLFAGIGLVDNLFGLTVIYVGISMSVAVWMMAAYIGTIPIELEEAAWIDGSSVFGGFFRVVLRNSLPGILSTAIFTFLTAWNEYMIAVIFLKSTSNLTLPIGLQMGRSPALTLVILLPPVLIFALLNRYFSVGGIGGSLAGR
jgi:multiple sugar transport system permease protein